MARSANRQLTILFTNFAPKRLILLASTLWYTNTIKKPLHCISWFILYYLLKETLKKQIHAHMKMRLHPTK